MLKFALVVSMLFQLGGGRIRHKSDEKETIQLKVDLTILAV